MPSKTTLRRALMAAAGISTALCLSACGGSSKPTGQATSHTSTAAAQASSAAQSSTITTATATRSLSPRARAQANRAALASFTACLRKHGMHVPPQNLSDPKLKFNTKGIDTSSARYQRAGAACLSTITAAYRSATADGR